MHQLRELLPDHGQNQLPIPDPARNLCSQLLDSGMLGGGGGSDPRTSWGVKSWFGGRGHGVEVLRGFGVRGLRMGRRAWVPALEIVGYPIVVSGPVILGNTQTARSQRASARSGRVAVVRLTSPLWGTKLTISGHMICAGAQIPADFLAITIQIKTTRTGHLVALWWSRRAIRRGSKVSQRVMPQTLSCPCAIHSPPRTLGICYRRVRVSPKIIPLPGFVTWGCGRCLREVGGSWSSVASSQSRRVSPSAAVWLGRASGMFSSEAA